MIYLRKFNESFSIDITNLKQLADDYLSYLYDDEFITDVYDDKDAETIVITFRKSNECWNRYNNEYESGNIRTSSKRPNEFSWDDIKDQFIPFMTILADKYDAMKNADIIFIPKFGDNFTLSVDDIINDEVESKIENIKRLTCVKIDLWRFSKVNEENLLEKTWVKKGKELREYCENYLAFIIEHFNLEIVHNNNNTFIINFTRKSNDGTNYPPRTFKWDKIKDYFIPFFGMLSQDYELISTSKLIPNSVITLKSWDDAEWYFKLDDILDDKIDEINKKLEDGFLDLDLYNLIRITFAVKE